MRLLIKLPSRSRPAKMFAAIENIQSYIGDIEYGIALTLDLDDTTVNNDEVKNRLKGYDNLIVYWGLSKSKINAINRSMPMGYSWTHLLVTADDMVFTKKDFGKDIQEAFKQNPEAGLIHFPDGKLGDRLITLPLMTREYYERFGYVYHPDYFSVYCDGEQMEVAKKLGKYKYIPTEIVLHKQYRWTGDQPDELNKIQDNSEVYKRDRKVFLERQAKNFDL